MRLDIDGALVQSHDAHDRAQQSCLAAAAGSQQTVAAIEQRIVNVKYRKLTKHWDCTFSTARGEMCVGFKGNSITWAFLKL